MRAQQHKQRPEKCRIKLQCLAVNKVECERKVTFYADIIHTHTHTHNIVQTHAYTRRERITKGDIQN